MDQSFTRLRNFLSTLVSIPEDQWKPLVALISRQTVKKGELFLRPGQDSRDFAFITAGLVRKYYVDSEGREYIKGFAAEGQLVGSYDSLISGRPSPIGIEALEDTHLLVMNFDKFKSLSNTHPAWKEASLKATEKMVIQREKRESQFLMQSASERYLEFASEYPELAKRVPQYHIASYIGVTPEGLNRIIKKLNQPNR